LVGSATLVAVILPLPPVAGAVNTPAVVIDPIVAAHVTDSLVVDPWIAAVNWTFALGAGEATAGEIVIELTSGVVDEAAPCNGSMTARCAASVMNDTLPSTFPVLDAKNFTLKLVLFPAARLTGMVSPVMLNPVPVRTA